MSFWLEVGKVTIPALVTIAVVFLGRYFEQKKANEQKIREKKIEVYEKFVSRVLDFLTNFPKVHNNQKMKHNQELEKVYDEFHKNLLFWGSDKIIKEYNDWRYKLTQSRGSLKDFEKLLYAFRKDVGHDNKKLKETDLLKLLIKPEEFDNQGNPKDKNAYTKSCLE